MSEQHDEMSDLEQRLHRTLMALSDWMQRAVCFSEQVCAGSPENAAVLFSRICVQVCSERRIETVVTAHAAFLSLLHHLWEQEHFVHTREAAAGLAQEVALSFLVWPVFPELESDRAIPSANNADRPISLGERKSLAAMPSRRTIEKTMLDPNPMVTRKVLENPLLTENDVVRISASSRACPAVLSEISLHVRWRQRRDVQLALLNNRLMPTDFGLTLIPFLEVSSVRTIGRDQRLDPAIRSAATTLLNAVRISYSSV